MCNIILQQATELTRLILAVCDNQIERPGAPASSGCNMPCAGNSAETCGGNLRIDIYQSVESVSTKSWHLLGCYTDNASARTLSYYQSNAPAGLTVEICQGLCLNEGYSYAGVEYANECCTFCSYDFPFVDGANKLDSVQFATTKSKMAVPPPPRGVTWLVVAIRLRHVVGILDWICINTIRSGIDRLR